MSNKIEKYEDEIFDFLTDVDIPFNIDDVFNEIKVKKVTSELKEELEKLLVTFDEFVEDDYIFYPKNVFLKDIPFRVYPTEYEIEKGIFIPGHRLLPFHPISMIADDVSFSFAYNNEPVKMQTISMKMEELHIYFSLMDIQKIPIMNIEDLLEEDADLQINVCSMKEFYKKFKFKMGDTLILRPLDFNEGLFTIEYDSLENYQDHYFEIENKDRAFLSALKKVMEMDLKFPNAEKQLLYTYFLMKKDKKNRWEIPGTSLGPLLAKNKDITFSALANGRTMFHFTHQDVAELPAYPDLEEFIDDDEEEPDLETINGILKFLNNSYNLTFVRALLFDRITEGADFNFEEIKALIFNNSIDQFLPAELEKKLKRLTQAEYRKIKKDFDLNYAFLPITTMRKAILEEAEGITAFLRELDNQQVMLDQLPKNEMMQLMELHHVFDQILIELETSQLSGECDVNEFRHIGKIIDRISNQLPILMNIIRSKIES